MTRRTLQLTRVSVNSSVTSSPSMRTFLRSWTMPFEMFSGSGLDIPQLYGTARELLRLFNVESGFANDQASREEFHARVVRGSVSARLPDPRHVIPYIIPSMRRRDFVTALAAASAAAAQTPAPAVERKGRLKQSVMRVNFDPKMPFEDMCREAARLGAKGFDLIGPNDWPTLRKYGLTPTMVPGPASIQDGMIRKELHDALEKSMTATIDQCGAAACPNMITVGGQRKGMSNAEGADNCVAFLNRIKARAEDKGVTVCMEGMNNRLTPD